MKVLAFYKGKAKLVEVPVSFLRKFPVRDLTPNDILLCTTVETIKNEDIQWTRDDDEEDY